MNQLAHRQQFERLLRNYQLSAKAAVLLEKIRLVLLAGPTAAGRNTIIENLVNGGGYKYIVSDTTRSPRTNNGIPEQNGVNYWFRSEEQFLSELKAGEFLEAEIIHDQQVSGISIRELAKAERSGKVAITEIEIGGFNNILMRKPDATGIFILPPSFQDWIARLLGRGTIPKEEMISRLHTGIRIFREAIINQHALIVINSDLDTATRDVDAIVCGKLAPDMSLGRQTATQLLGETEKYLSSL